MRAPRGPGFRKERATRRESEQAERKRKKGRGWERVEERIVESNIRRTFTVRFPNLYCVWQRCRDIRGSYRNVLLLIVLHPEGSRRPRTKGSSVPNGDGKSGKRDGFERTRDRRQLYREEEGREGGQKGGISAKGRKRGKERRLGRERKREGKDRKGAGERQRKRGRERERSGNTACTGAFDRPMN